ncbi:ABC-type transport auxiliary lipoprotein family protein [Oceaniglobus ichthyenteri]|uniref:ABC-type transport auxiliary lipoprotein family protein n=1 Tax=Oceaniglobus ichthyenteri TaxID=2136177 RepID=UPI000D3B4A52|nr:ABC-type transport auxiliary lipoprotein family protein [Oceaniglobus ichthyenteri]
MTQTLILTRRAALIGAAASLGGCSAVSSLNSAATPLDTFDLRPVPGATTGRRTARTILVARPTTPAAIATDRIVVKPNALAVTYLPESRWADDLPAVLQSLIVRSIAGTGRVGYVGPNEGGPVPDVALLSRVDAFQVEATNPGFSVVIDISLTLMRDRDQQVIATRVFRQRATATDDIPSVLIPAFQTVLDGLLPDIANWVVATA